MDWTDEESAELMKVWQAVDPLEDRVEAIATRAVELVAARCGTMTAEELLLTPIETGAGPTGGARVRDHIAAQGARIAALEERLALADKGVDPESPAAHAARLQDKRIALLEQEGATLKADNAVLLEALTPVASQARAVFEVHHAPSRCALGLNLKVSDGEAILTALDSPHPGAALLGRHTAEIQQAYMNGVSATSAALLEEHRRAWDIILLVAPAVAVLSRAEEVAPSIRAELAAVEARKMVNNVGLHNLASLIEVAKEPES